MIRTNYDPVMECGESGCHMRGPGDAGSLRSLARGSGQSGSLGKASSCLGPVCGVGVCGRMSEGGGSAGVARSW